jgi:hypothetical protein
LDKSVIILPPAVLTPAPFSVTMSLMLPAEILEQSYQDVYIF